MKLQSPKIQAQQEFSRSFSPGGVVFKMKSRGFTLIEILVAVAIFSIIIGAAIGVFTSALKAQRRVLAQQEILGEMSYALDYMSRTIRMAKKDAGVNYTITTTGQGGVKFKNYNSNYQEFYLEDNKLKEQINLDPPLDLTSPNITVSDFKIILSGEGDDDLQPAVTLFIEITSPDLTKSQFQTTISQRNLDIYP